MTITERNQKLYELLERLNKARNEVAWIETQIMAVRQQYKDEQLGDLFEEMFFLDDIEGPEHESTFEIDYTTQE